MASDKLLEAKRMQARAMQKAALAATQPQDSGQLAFLNRGIALTLGAPVDLANLALSFVGLGSEEPVGGSRSIERAMGATGVQVPKEGEKAEGGELVAQAVGSAVGGLPLAPLMAGVRGSSAAAEGFRRIGQTAIRRPVTTAAVEIASGAGAGAGQVLAREAFPESDLAEVIGSMAGGLALPALPALAFRISGGRMATRVARSVFAGRTEAGRRQQAADKLRRLAGDEQPVVERRLEQPDVLPQAGLTPAQITGNRRLLALERAVLDTNPKLESLFRDRFARSNRVVREEIIGLGRGGSPEATRNFIARRRDYLVGLMNERVKRAHALTTQRLARLAPGASRSEANQIVREELDAALQASVATEREIWDALPLDLRVGTAHTREALLTSVAELVKGETLADLPFELRRFLQTTTRDLPVETTLQRVRERLPAEEGEPRVTIERVTRTRGVPGEPPAVSMGRTVTSAEEGGTVTEGVGRAQPSPVKARLTLAPAEQARVLHKARSRALEAMRIAKAEGRRNDARLLDRFQEAILGDLNALEGRVSGELGESYRSALNYSRQLNEKFRRGTVGKLLGFSRTGGAAVPAELTLERSIAGGGPGAGVAADEILRAVDASPAAARQGMEDMARSMFASQAVDPNGRFNPAAASRFLGRNEALLNRFPGLRREIEDTISAGRLSDDLQARTDRLIKGLHDKRLSRAALFLNANVDEEFKAVLRDPNPRKAARDLMRMAAKDRSGEATKGVQAAVAEFLTRAAGTGKFDAEGVELLSGRAMRRALQGEPRIQSAVSEILTAEQRQNLDRIITTLERMELSQGRTPDIGGILDPASVPILDFVVRTVGARLGAQAGAGTTGASLLTSHFGAERARRSLNAFMDWVARAGPRQLLTDAVQDRQLMLALLTKPDSFENQRFIAQRLHGWLIGLGDDRVNEILETE